LERERETRTHIHVTYNYMVKHFSIVLGESDDDSAGCLHLMELLYLTYVGIFRDRLCGLVVKVPGCKPRGPGYDSRRYNILYVAVGLERGPPSLVRINEELLERKVAAPV
jgi:hypothetical protein